MCRGSLELWRPFFKVTGQDLNLVNGAGSGRRLEWTERGHHTRCERAAIEANLEMEKRGSVHPLATWERGSLFGWNSEGSLCKRMFLMAATQAEHAAAQLYATLYLKYSSDTGGKWKTTSKMRKELLQFIRFCFMKYCCRDAGPLKKKTSKQWFHFKGILLQHHNLLWALWRTARLWKYVIYVYYSVYSVHSVTTVERIFPELLGLVCGCILWETSAWKPAQGEGSANGETKQLWCRGVADARGHMFPQNRNNNIRDLPPLFPSLPWGDEKHRVLTVDQNG